MSMPRKTQKWCKAPLPDTDASHGRYATWYDTFCPSLSKQLEKDGWCGKRNMLSNCQHVWCKRTDNAHDRGMILSSCINKILRVYWKIHPPDLFIFITASCAVRSCSFVNWCRQFHNISFHSDVINFGCQHVQLLSMWIFFTWSWHSCHSFLFFF